MSYIGLIVTSQSYATVKTLPKGFSTCQRYENSRRNIMIIAESISNIWNSKEI